MKNAQDIFEDAMDLPPEARDDFVSGRCAGDKVMFNEVMALLSFVDEDEEDEDWMPQDAAQKSRDILINTKIGRYTLRSVIGEGGFGVVYMAEQTQPVRRRVAIKIIKLGMDSKAVISRFQAERQALAIMDHPGVARIFDGGTTDQGRPYFVMELVDGVPITEYCDMHTLDLRERIILFQSVCDAIQHAHTKGVIHRDLKPSNILVEYLDGQPVIKVIDFGIAKALNQELTEQTLFTESGQLIGTPEYMSPEQAEMSALNVDTRSDVYSLGILLYELLSGALPFDSKSLRAAGIAEIQRIIREEDPPKPSTRYGSVMTSSVEDCETIARARAADPKALPRSLQGDLDWITMKCLEKERSRRYESPSALAQDLSRHLEDRPVEATAPTLRYRMGKYCRRNRRQVITASILAPLGIGLLVFAGILTISYQTKKIQADYQDNLIQQVLDEVINLSNARNAIESGLIVIDAAKNQVLKLEDSIPPEMYISARLTIARSYARLKEHEKAIDEFKTIIELSRIHFRDVSQEIFVARTELLQSKEELLRQRKDITDGELMGLIDEYITLIKSWQENSSSLQGNGFIAGMECRIGNLASRLGDNDMARKHHLKGFELFADLDRREMYTDAKSHMVLAAVSLSMADDKLGDVLSSIAWAQTALDIASDYEKSENQRTAPKWKSASLKQHGLCRLAYAHSRRAVELCKSGQIYESMDQFKKAHDAANSAIALLEDSSTELLNQFKTYGHQSRAGVLHDESMSYRIFHDSPQKSLKCSEECINEWLKTDKPEQIPSTYILNHVACLRDAGRLDEAIQFGEGLLDRQTREKPLNLIELSETIELLGDVYRDAEQPNQAERIERIIPENTD